VTFSLLCQRLPPGLLLSAAVHFQLLAGAATTVKYIVLCHWQNPYRRHQRGTHTLPMPGCRQAVWLTWCDIAPLPRRSLCRTVSLAIRQAVWMGCHRLWETSKKVKSETEKEVMSSGSACINMVWRRWLTLYFRWCWYTEARAMLVLTFLLRTDVCHQWRFNGYSSPWSHC